VTGKTTALNTAQSEKLFNKLYLTRLPTSCSFNNSLSSQTAVAKTAIVAPKMKARSPILPMNKNAIPY
jgi:hypothetical protein